MATARDWHPRDEAIRLAELFAPFLAEFMGSFFIALTYGFNRLTGTLVWLSTSVAFAIMVGMASTVNTSGGHLNPSVTLAFALARKFGWARAVGYWAAQILGALLAGVAVTKNLHSQIAVAPHEKFYHLDVGVVEVVFTVLMCFTALSCLASVRKDSKGQRKQFSSVAVGFVYIAGGLAAFHISGAFFNPALAIAYGCTGAKDNWSWLLWYVGFQVSGSIIAALLFFLLRPEELLGSGRADDGGLDWRRACAKVCPCCFGDRARGRGAARNAGQLSSAAAGVADLEACDEVGMPLASRRSSLPVRLLAEFLGAFLIVAIYGMSVAGTKLAVQSMEADLARADLVRQGENPDVRREYLKQRLAEDQKNMQSATHWATGAAVVSLTYALGDVSGAHFNPAITLAAAFSQPGMWEMAGSLLIILSQCSGGVVGAVVYSLLARNHDGLTVMELGPGEGHRIRSVYLGEMVFTCAVAVVALSVTSVRSPRYARAPTVHSFPFALAIGFCIAGGGLTIDHQGGGILNPALALGISTANVLGSSFSISSISKHVPILLIYVLWEMVGGFVASMVFVMTHPLEYKKDPLMV